MVLSLVAFVQLAAACAPAVHVDTLAAIARTESGFRTLAIHDNSTGKSLRVRTAPEASALAKTLLRQGHSLDLGLMQINSGNLASLGISVESAFDPCRNIAGGARVLQMGFEAPPSGQDAQPALLRAVSRYNTGHPERGFKNGYVGRVQASANHVVPAIRVAGTEPIGQSAETAAAPSPPLPPPPWDVYGQAQWRRGQALAGSSSALPVRLQAQIASDDR